MSTINDLTTAETLFVAEETMPDNGSPSPQKKLWYSLVAFLRHLELGDGLAHVIAAEELAEGLLRLRQHKRDRVIRRMQDGLTDEQAREAIARSKDARFDSEQGSTQ